jgi:hypothetical protein
MYVDTSNTTVARLTVSAIARRLGCLPADVTALFYKTRLFHSPLAPLVGNRRMIDPQLLPEIEALLREQGRIPDAVADDTETPAAP